MPTCQRLPYQCFDLSENALEELSRSARVEHTASQSFKVHAKTQRGPEDGGYLYLYFFILPPDYHVMMPKDSGASLDNSGDDAFRLPEQSKTGQRSTLSSVDNGWAKTASMSLPKTLSLPSTTQVVPSAFWACVVGLVRSQRACFSDLHISARSQRGCCRQQYHLL